MGIFECQSQTFEDARSEVFSWLGCQAPGQYNQFGVNPTRVVIYEVKDAILLDLDSQKEYVKQLQAELDAQKEAEIELERERQQMSRYTKKQRRR